MAKLVMRVGNTYLTRSDRPISITSSTTYPGDPFGWFTTYHDQYGVSYNRRGRTGFFQDDSDLVSELTKKQYQSYRYGDRVAQLFSTPHRKPLNTH